MTAEPRASVATAPPAQPIQVPSGLLELVGDPLQLPQPWPGVPRLLVTPVPPPPPQAQACLLLQKTLPTRELRLCFKDPEWKQLLDQILAKVTEVMATGLLSPARWRWFSGNQGLLAPAPGGAGWGFPRGDVSLLGALISSWGQQQGFGQLSGGAQPGRLLLRPCGRWVRPRPSQGTRRSCPPWSC